MLFRYHRYLILMVLALSVLASVAQEASRHSYGPPNGFVPNEATAIRIAVAIWEPIYGKEAIAKQAPYGQVGEQGLDCERYTPATCARWRRDCRDFQRRRQNHQSKSWQIGTDGNGAYPGTLEFSAPCCRRCTLRVSTMATPASSPDRKSVV